MREENRSTQRKTLGVRFRSTEPHMVYCAGDEREGHAGEFEEGETGSQGQICTVGISLAQQIHGL